jgi:hypothetical protein
MKCEDCEGPCSRPIQQPAEEPDRALYDKKGKLPFGIVDKELYDFNQWLLVRDADTATSAKEKMLETISDRIHSRCFHKFSWEDFEDEMNNMRSEVKKR